MEITLIPELYDSNLKLRLEGLLNRCIRFRGCTAFWTICINFFSSKAFAEALKKQDSFFCTDIQLPTSISNIKEYYDYGAKNIYLHHYKLYTKNKKDRNTHLLHSKILVFDMNETEAEIWIGSHNLTGRAIVGLNLEASVAIKCNKIDKIYIDTCAYLGDIKKNFCVQFDPERIDIYLKLQNDEDKDVGDISETLEIVGEDMDNLQDEKIIQLLSGSSTEFYKYKRIGTKIYLYAYDIRTEIKYLYECEIEQAGKLGKDNKLELDFVEERRFAKIQTGSRMPYPLLYPQTKINDDILDGCKYFVNISIVRKIDDFEVYKKPNAADLSFWKKPTDTKNPYLVRKNAIYHYENIEVDFDANDGWHQNILEATFDEKVDLKPVDLKAEWKELGVKNAKRYDNHLKKFKEHFTEKFKEVLCLDKHWFDHNDWYDIHTEEMYILQSKQDKKSIPSLKERIVVIILIIE